VTTRQARIRAEVTARAKPLEQALARWLTAYGRVLAAQETKRIGATIKASTDEDRLRDELRTLLLRFGLRQAETSAQGAAKSVGQDIIIPGTLLSDAIAGKPTKIKWFWEYRNGVHQRVNDIMETTRDEVRASVRRIVQDAVAEDREPSMGEVARRIHTQFHGVEADGRIRTFSPERAAIIAQTEMGQAENTGIFEGYKASGVSEIEWLARPGSERHGSLSGKRVKVGEYFVASNGDRLRYPGDPSAPIRSTINCMCTSVAVIARRKKA
jgi:hypothetical protein